MGKFTLLLTQQCNLRCGYCYIQKRPADMPLAVADKVIDFIFNHAPPTEKIDIGFFGGEPLLKFDLLMKLTESIKKHPGYRQDQVVLSVVSNGTIFSDTIADYLVRENIHLCLSCDGPPETQDVHRRYANGKPSSKVVENTIKKAVSSLPELYVNAVFHPSTFRHLSQAVDYFSSLGVNQIHLNPDFSAAWSAQDMDLLDEVYGEIGKRYAGYYLEQRPHYINLVDSKIALILRGGYKPCEMCHMGKGEFAFTPEGNIYLCERLVGSGDGSQHCIGNVHDGLRTGSRHCGSLSTLSSNPECLQCGIRDYCMRWCGCSNYLATGHYDRVSAFLCASEKAAMRVAFDVFKYLEKTMGPVFLEHLSGSPRLNSRLSN